MGKQHGDGARASSNHAQSPGKHRGVETGNGYTASTGRGKPKGVVWQGRAPLPPGRRSVLRTIGDVIRGKHRRQR